MFTPPLRAHAVRRRDEHLAVARLDTGLAFLAPRSLDRQAGPPRQHDMERGRRQASLRHTREHNTTRVVETPLALAVIASR